MGLLFLNVTEQTIVDFVLSGRCKLTYVKDIQLFLYDPSNLTCLLRTEMIN